MDTRLYQAGYLAIPLKANEGHSLNPQPTFKHDKIRTSIS